MRKNPPQNPVQSEEIHHLYDLEDYRDTKVVDVEVQKKLLKVSQELLIRLYTLMRTLKFHYHDNQAVQQTLEQLYRAVKELFEYEYEIHIEFTGTDFLVNERWSKLARQYQELCAKLGDEWRKREIGGLWITTLPPKEGLLQFVELIVSVDPAQMANPFALIQSQLWRKKLHWVSLEKFVEIENWEKDKLEPREAIRQVYFQAIEAMKQIQVQVESGRPIKLKIAKRVIQSLIGLIETPHFAEELPLLLSLVHLKGWTEYSLSHPVNVAVLAVGWGVSMQLPRLFLRDLGISSLMADSGLIKLMAENSLEDLKQLPREIFEKHPTEAIPILLQTSLIDSTILRSTNVAFTHHSGWQSGGFPPFARGLNCLSAQIIAISEYYDALISPESPAQRTLTPPEALGELAIVPPSYFHSPLVKLFISWLGPIPIGTFVKLSDGSAGYVWLKSADPQAPHRPVVKILKSANFRPGQLLDLSQYAGSGYNLEIAEIVPPHNREYQLLLMADLLR